MKNELKPLEGNPNLHESLIGRTCECCGKSDLLAGVASMSLAPMSILWCNLCLNMGANPLWAIEATVESCGGVDNVGADLVYFNTDRDNYVDYRNNETIPIEFNDGKQSKTRTEAIEIIRKMDKNG